MASQAWVECLCQLDGVCARKEKVWVQKIADALAKNELSQPDEMLGLCLGELDLQTLDAVFVY
jgi:hypothetical protein